MNHPAPGRPVLARRLIPLIALAWVTTALPSSSGCLAAQVRPQTVVAIPEVFPDVESRSLLVRTPGLDVVLLRDDDDAADALLMATALLSKLRAERPHLDAGTGQMVPITGFVITRAPGPGQRRQVDDAVRRVRAAPLAELGSVGRARWIDYPVR
jgi:hypothetical protein